MTESRGGVMLRAVRFFLWNPRTMPLRGARSASVVRLGAGLLVLVLALALAVPWPAAAQDAEERRLGLELRKLELEVAKLEEAPAPWHVLLAPLIGFMSGVVGAGVALYAGHRTRRAALDQKTHEARLELYPLLVSATERLAVFFPPPDEPVRASLDPAACRAIGRSLSAWYFEKGGLLLSAEARAVYFRLARALTLAAAAPDLAAPVFPDDAPAVSLKGLDAWRATLRAAGLPLDDVEAWPFGAAGAEAEPALRFKDYVLLRQLSSDLRTVLTEDLHSRRRPV